MALMRLEQPIANIVITDESGLVGARFVTSLELAMVLIWFLSSTTARALAVAIYETIVDLNSWLEGWRRDLVIMAGLRWRIVAGGGWADDLRIICKAIRLIFLKEDRAYGLAF
ncbi:MAG: hypothetical protein ACREIQ_06055 [Nitrospiria bacterium]